MVSGWRILLISLLSSGHICYEWTLKRLLSRQCKRPLVLFLRLLLQKLFHVRQSISQIGIELGIVSDFGQLLIPQFHFRYLRLIWDIPVFNFGRSVHGRQHAFWAVRGRDLQAYICEFLGPFALIQEISLLGWGRLSGRLWGSAKINNHEDDAYLEGLSLKQAWWRGLRVKGLLIFRRFTLNVSARTDFC